MGWSRRIAGALVGALIVVASIAAPSAADTSTTALVVGLEGPGGAAALAGAGVEVTDVAEGLGAVRVAVPAPRAAAARAALAAAPGIAYVEPDHRVAKMATPTDTYWSQQWGLRKVSAPAAWDVTTGAPSAVVAVLDTGVNPISEFAGKLLPGIDLVNGDQDPADDDVDRHGTAVAAVAAAKANDGGVAGMCWTCSILPVKVLGADGTGSSFHVARGITWATDHGADVLVLSLGGTGSSTTVLDAVAYARSRGVVVVAAAGNDGVTTPNYPAAYPGVIAVAGSTSADGREPWSNHGSWVDLAAPGCNYAPAASGYDHFCGTSSATPFAAGVAALGVALGAGGTTIEDAMRSTAIPVGTWISHGRIDALKTVRAVRDVVEAPRRAEAFVRAVVQDFVARPATSAEVVRWRDHILAGGSRDHVTRAYASSDEWIGAIVDGLYRSTLGRPADAAGRSYWVDVIRQGTTPAWVASYFYASDEYYARAGGTDTAWVQDLYAKILGRKADAKGLAYWTERARTVPRSAITYDFYQSLESRRDRVDHLFRTLLGRAPDSSGWTYWAETLSNGRDIDIAVFLAAGDEYARRAFTRYP